MIALCPVMGNDTHVGGPVALQRDFLMRMLERLADAFFRIAAGKATEDPEQSLFEIEDLLAEALGTSREYALGLGPAAMDTVEPALASELSRLLLLHGRLSDQAGRPDRATRARRMGLRAIERALERPSTDFAKLAAGQLREHLDDLVPLMTPEALAALCMAAHRASVHARAWAEAENWAFFALEVERPAHVAEVHAFYVQLLELSDEELEAGGLTRIEVEESHREIDES